MTRRIRAAARAALAALRGSPDAAAGGTAGPTPGSTATKASPAGEKAGGASGEPGNPFAEANTQYLNSIKWLIGALAAIAALLLAGTQLSDVRELSWPEDRIRILLAGGTFTVVLLSVVVAVGLLAHVQMPGRGSDLARLKKIVQEGQDHEVVRSVDEDSSYHRGTGSLANLLAKVAETSTEYYQARDDAITARLAAAADPESTPLAKTKEAAEATLSVRSEIYARYRLGLRQVSQLDGHLQIASRAQRVTKIVLVLTWISALCLVGFVWAANPPGAPADKALDPAPVAAHLRLTSDGEVWAQRLGAGCAEAAAEDAGIPVIALSSATGGVTVMVVPSEVCPDPVQVTVAAGEGTVTPDEVVELPAS